MIWERLAEEHERAKDARGDDERVRVAKAAAALWPQATAEDLDWLTASIEHLSDLDFINTLLHYVPSAPPRLLETLITGAVRTPREGTQFERTFTEHAITFYGVSAVEEALLRHVARGVVEEVRRATEILTWWMTPTPAMKGRCEVAYARRFLVASELDLELILVPLLRFDEAGFPPAEREVIRRAREKAQSHPVEGLRAFAEHRLRFAALLRRMPAWMRPAWEATGEERQQALRDAAYQWPERDTETTSWVIAALGYPDERLHYFAAQMLRGAPPAMERPEALRHALADAAVSEMDPSFDRVFVAPAVALFGADAVVNDLLDRMGSGDERRTVGASQALYWAHGETPETARRTAHLHLTCFVGGSPELRRCLAQRFSLDAAGYPPAMRHMVEIARAWAHAEGSESVRRWAGEA